MHHHLTTAREKALLGWPTWREMARARARASDELQSVRAIS